ncbi:hypothetical protein M407DRAFT_3279 [Tulasnella calospora MUT 4182]|uniref:Response regulatory domain-containing protein n=1 Tax=Tulasnella calospora MUT 4182 TaxID=1051891 RepID=A0A0C3QZ00_9AGAM|nr:hypothetical protein M407DRAFT_3279 [Tulasnella calospora MUT 4182]
MALGLSCAGENLSVCPEQLGDLLAKCWSREPNKRPTAVDCLRIIESTSFSLNQEVSSEAGPSLAANPMDGIELLESPGGSRLRIRKAFTPAWAVPPRVLLVDDDQVSRKLFSKFLQVSGCTVDVAVDGLGAVNKMNLEKYDLVLMDIVMPRLDGVSATSLIRQFDHMTPIIAITSNFKPNDVVTYYSSGMNDILPKPFTRESLFTMLEKHLMHLKAITMARPVAEKPSKGLSEDQYSSMLNFLGMTGFPPLDPTAGLVMSDRAASGKRAFEAVDDDRESKRPRFESIIDLYISASNQGAGKIERLAGEVWVIIAGGATPRPFRRMGREKGPRVPRDRDERDGVTHSFDMKAGREEEKRRYKKDMRLAKRASSRPDKLVALKTYLLDVVGDGNTGNGNAERKRDWG